MKESTKIYLIGIAVLSILLACIIVPRVLPKYNTDWIIGKSVDEVVDRYGEFVITRNTSESSKMRGYYIKEESSHDLFGGYIPEKYLVIYFDENEIAYMCEEEWGPN